jgi:hypothetical protein
MLWAALAMDVERCMVLRVCEEMNFSKGFRPSDLKVGF